MRGPFIPLMLMTFTALVWSAFQGVQLYVERQNLERLYAGQESQLQASAKVRTALDALAGDIDRLAKAGNGNAKLVVEGLRNRGITINVNQGGAQPSK